MFELKNIVRKNIAKLQAYSSARDEFNGDEGVFLDANENPYGSLNRYPDPYQKTLKRKLSAVKSTTPENIFIGNGSDEIIDLAYRIFCTPGVDKALTFSPTYGMYEVSANINDVELITLPLNKKFQLDLATLDEVLKDESIKLIFVCSPNNPTGNIIENIDYILQNFNGIVVVDEAYADFTNRASLIDQLKQYPNLIVAQTFSKAWGLAAARVGVAYAHADIIAIFNKVKPPYNVSALNQQAALDALNQMPVFSSNQISLVEQRKFLEKVLPQLAIVQKVYPSDANFLLLKVSNATRVYNELILRGFIVRNRTSIIDNCLRITVGTAQENTQLINALQEIKK